jgi:DNA polymerase-3 subunit beta
MKFSVSSKDLQKKLDNLHKVARNKTSLPILSYFKVDVFQDKLDITASDLEVTLTATIIPEEVKEVGSICILADKFTEVVKNFKDSMLEISLDPKNNLIIKSKSGKFKIPCTSAEDFPVVHEPKENTEIIVPAATILSGINKTAFAAYKSDLRPIQCGVYFDFDLDKTVAVATDGVKLGLVYDQPFVGVKKSVVFPTKLCSLVVGLVGENDNEIELLFDEKNIKLTLTEYSIYSKKIDGTFLDYTIAINQSVDTIFTVATGELLDAVKRSMIFSNEYGIVVLSVLVGRILVSGENIDFGLSAEEELACENKEGSGIFKTNGRFLLEIINRVSTDAVEISFSSTTSMVYFNPVGTTENYLFGLMKYA